jgi:hypothetical protein
MYGFPHAAIWSHEQLLGQTSEPRAVSTLLSFQMEATNSGDVAVTLEFQFQNDAAPTYPRGLQTNTPPCWQVHLIRTCANAIIQISKLLARPKLAKLRTCRKLSATQISVSMPNPPKGRHAC